MNFTENIISWNFANWVTVVLMAALGYALMTFVAKLFIRTEELKNA